MKGLLTVAWKNLRHRLAASISLVLLIAVLFSDGSLLRAMVRSQTRTAEAMAEQTKITCIVTNASGTKTVGIGVFSAPYAMMLQGKLRDRGCTVDDFVRDLRLTAREELRTPERAVLIRANCPEALGPDLTLEFQNGADGSCFSGTELVCCISPDLLPRVDENGSIRLDRTFLPSVSLRVIGTVCGADGTVICPFDAQLIDGTESFLLDRCSFTLSDTRRLDEAKAALSDWFVAPKLTNADRPGEAGILILDAEYTAAAEEIRAHIVLFKRLRVLCLILSGVLGFLIGFLMNRKRRREFAVMRCLGLRRTTVMRAAALEHLLPMLPGVGIGVCAALAWMPDASGLTDGILQMLLYLCGGLASVGLLTRVEPIRLMKEEE
ncbi:MAG: ABC transporter permease [Clostridia bacterium]|nr:ABC transporter permease [Clostridia bacterium]